MPRSKTQSPPTDTVRKRVFKACQRCRLKKCKCDGATPCNRCKSDDAICAYGKHKKTDKIIFRKGYVQMLERQHAQLIAGLQELYRLTQNGRGWCQPPLELVNHGQPLTHKILEGLGVLRTEEWDEGGGQGGLSSSWTSFEQQAQDGRGALYDASESASSNTTPMLSPKSAVQCAFPNSTIMAKRISKYDLPTSYPSNTPSVSGPHLFDGAAFPYSMESNLPKPGCYDTGLHLQIPSHISTSSSNMRSRSARQPDVINCMADQSQGLGNIDWMSLGDDMFDPPITQGLPLEVQ